jgi:hypothetical protein
MEESNTNWWRLLDWKRGEKREREQRLDRKKRTTHHAVTWPFPESYNTPHSLILTINDQHVLVVFPLSFIQFVHSAPRVYKSSKIPGVSLQAHCAHCDVLLLKLQSQNFQPLFFLFDSRAFKFRFFNMRPLCEEETKTFFEKVCSLH